MNDPQPNNPLHGITLKQMLTELHEFYGWEDLSECIDINCFQNNPSIKSSLKFLRRTPWAREKVERLYLETINERNNITLSQAEHTTREVFSHQKSGN